MSASATPEQSTGAHTADVTALRDAAAALDGGVIAVTGADTSLSLAAAQHAATSDARTVWTRRSPADLDDERDLDVHLAVPAGATWTVEEVEKEILAPARLRPLHRAHIVVADAHRMAQVASDRLLKALEEPRTDVLFWLCVPNADSMSATLRSRTARNIEVRPTPASERLEAVRAAGATHEQSLEILELAGANTRLALAAARHDGLAELTVLAHVPTSLSSAPSGRPSASADRIVASSARLAAMLTAVRKLRAATTNDARASWDRLDSHGRGQARSLLRACLANCGDAAAASLLTDPSRERVARVATILAASDQARRELDLNAHPVTVMSAFLSRAR